MTHPDFSRMSREQFDAAYQIARMSPTELDNLRQAVWQQLSRADEKVLEIVNQPNIDNARLVAMREANKVSAILQDHYNVISTLETQRICHELSMETLARRLRQRGL